MPKDYVKDKKKFLRQGYSLKEAKRRAAINYWYRHGKPVGRHHGK